MPGLNYEKKIWARGLPTRKFLRIQKRAGEIGAALVATTEKDWVKLGRDIQWNIDLAVIGIKIKFENANAFENFLKSRMESVLFKSPVAELD